MKTDQGCVVWLTGISGAGKSTIAEAIAGALRNTGKPVFPVDGDDLRGGLSSDLSFTAADRLENMRRAAELAHMASKCGLVTVVSLISPSAQGRQMVRELVRHGRFALVYVKTPIEVAESRDVKGLYKKARAGLIANFTGIGSDYEAPGNSEIVIDTTTTTPDAAAALITTYLQGKGWVS
ncbi:adenylyl-sulfate kinase [Uliginosibacterium sp. H1]|uniref:adenylyl-sulfate kinase n=1 Tax=Uliginosibacterium sp. H1 TaxID=3114757 RepID=UPI002E18AFAC|nr:adenylyl-sulfate kinase [Uliginosibacterium sp. H1]